MRLRSLLPALFLLAGLMVGATSARATKPAAQAAKKTAAHDGKAHSTWESENRKRWRKQLKHRKAPPGFSMKTQDARVSAP